MEQILEYAPGTVLELELGTMRHVVIQSVKMYAPLMDVVMSESLPTARKMGRWIVEHKGKKVWLRETDFSQGDDCIVFKFQDGAIDVSLAYDAPQGKQEQVFQKVERIDVYPREVSRVRLIVRELLSPEKVEDKKVPREEKGETEVKFQRLEKEYQQLKEENQQLEAKCQSLEKELESTREMICSLRQMVDSRADSIIKTAHDKKLVLDESTVRKAAEIERLQREQESLQQKESGQKEELLRISAAIEELRQEFDRRREKKRRLEEELEKLNAQKEFLDMDCAKAAGQLNELRIKIHLDMDTLALLEDDSIIKKGSVSKTLVELEKKVNAVEKRIALIIQFREKYNRVVERAVLSGDGTILSSDESGGIGNGGRETDPEKNP